MTDVITILRRWQQNSHIMLHAGEMSAQELRSVKAVVKAIEAEVAAVPSPDQQPDIRGQVKEKLRQIIKLDQCHEWNCTSQDTGYDGPCAKLARELLAVIKST